jgi:recombinational DNA repair ATPase RecF
MRIREIHIDRWRCFQEFHLLIPADASINCLVGENGTGKSSILELVRHSLTTLGIRGGSTESLAQKTPMVDADTRLSLKVDLELPDDFELINTIGYFVPAWRTPTIIE